MLHSWALSQFLFIKNIFYKGMEIHGEKKPTKIRERKQSEHILYQILFWSLPILLNLRRIQQQ